MQGLYYDDVRDIWSNYWKQTKRIFSSYQIEYEDCEGESFKKIKYSQSKKT